MFDHKLGTNKFRWGGSSGGSVLLKGGAAFGPHILGDHGGNIEIAGGYAAGGDGGSVILNSGRSQRTDSGKISLVTVDSGSEGVSGDINMETGDSKYGDSGYINIQTGDAYGKKRASSILNDKSAKAGYIHLKG